MLLDRTDALVKRAVVTVIKTVGPVKRKVVPVKRTVGPVMRMIAPPVRSTVALVKLSVVQQLVVSKGVNGPRGCLLVIVIWTR